MHPLNRVPSWGTPDTPRYPPTQTNYTHSTIWVHTALWYPRTFTHVDCVCLCIGFARFGCDPPFIDKPVNINAHTLILMRFGVQLSTCRSQGSFIATQIVRACPLHHTVTLDPTTPPCRSVTHDSRWFIIIRLSGKSAL